MAPPFWNVDQLEVVPCDICGSTNSEPFFVRPDGLTVVRCVECGLCFLSPRPNHASLHLLYDEAYFCSANGVRGIGYATYIDEGSRLAMLEVSRMRLSFARQLVPSLQIGGCLEVGCATGEFCETLRQAGATNTMGLDISDFAIATARTRYPAVSFVSGSVETLQHVGGCFQSVFAFEAIEHVPSPRSFLRCIANLLVPGGHAVLTTPNVACATKVGRNRWSGFLSSFEHLYFFDANTLTRCGCETGLEMVSWRTGGGEGLSSEPGEPATADPLWRKVARGGLEAACLLKVARTLKRRVSPPRLHYDESRFNHNLAIVFRRSDVP